MGPLLGFLVLLFLVATAVMIVVVIVDRVLAFSLKKKLLAFNNNYKLLSLGMTRQQVIDILGDKFIHSATIETETLSWSCDTNTSIQRELYSKKEAKKTIIVEFSGNSVISYRMQ